MARPVAAITGASSGIGAVFAHRLAPTHDLMLIARRRDRLEQLASELRKAHGVQVEVIQADLGSEQDTAALAKRLSAENRLALLVNNAGFGVQGPFWERPVEAQEQMHRVHVMATVRLSHAALAGMVARDNGAIINVSSVAAYIRSRGGASYCATKSWMTVFTEALYLELQAAHSKVRVQALCPGFTYSEFHDTLGVDRSALAPRSMWLTADQVVDASLRELETGKLFVVAGWQYRLATTLIPKLPVALRLWLETSMSRSRHRRISKKPAAD
jgi:short-subunit dehydrogenase